MNGRVQLPENRLRSALSGVPEPLHKGLAADLVAYPTHIQRVESESEPKADI
jgi:hypothetical protein